MKFTNIENDGTIRTYDDKEDSLIWDWIFRAVKRHDDKLDKRGPRVKHVNRFKFKWSVVIMMFLFVLFLILLSIIAGVTK